MFINDYDVTIANVMLNSHFQNKQAKILKKKKSYK